jgi:hypothetical protein
MRDIHNHCVPTFRETTTVEFIDENGGGPGVRLRKRLGSKKPK